MDRWGDRTKTTLPQAVTALVEEALCVLCLHATLAPLHAGLLMKLAEYVKEDEEGHLRCRWGEGEYCYGGDANSGKPSRWKQASDLTLQLRYGGRERSHSDSNNANRHDPTAPFEIYVSKDTFKFSASHFVAYPGFRERLHGLSHPHFYR